MNKINRCKPLLGTYVEVDISGDYSDEILLEISEKIFKRIEKIQSLMSFHDDESELSYINQNAYYHPCHISNEMRDILTKAIEIGHLTNGLYDISIADQLVKNGFLPDKSIRSDASATYKDININGNIIKFNKEMQIDLGGIAKGYAIDEALKEVNYDNLEVTINAGGDIASNVWKNQTISLRIPSKSKGLLRNIEMRNKALATSASYFFDNDKNPIISKRDGKMINDKRSVSVFAENCMTADALTKVVFLDENAIEILESQGANAIILDETGEIKELCQ